MKEIERIISGLLINPKLAYTQEDINKAVESVEQYVIKARADDLKELLELYEEFILHKGPVFIFTHRAHKAIEKLGDKFNESRN